MASEKKSKCHLRDETHVRPLGSIRTIRMFLISSMTWSIDRKKSGLIVLKLKRRDNYSCLSSSGNCSERQTRAKPRLVAIVLNSLSFTCRSWTVSFRQNNWSGSPFFPFVYRETSMDSPHLLSWEGTMSTSYQFLQQIPGDTGVLLWSPAYRTL